MTKLTALTLTEARDGLHKKQFSATELTKAFLENMETQRSLNAYITETPERALEGGERIRQASQFWNSKVA